MKAEYEIFDETKVPPTKKVTCQICFITNNTGFKYPHDLDEDYHEGFTIGKGKTLYWLMSWHPSGHVTVYKKDSREGLVKRWLDGDTKITIHFK